MDRYGIRVEGEEAEETKRATVINAYILETLRYQQCNTMPTVALKSFAKQWI